MQRFDLAGARKRPGVYMFVNKGSERDLDGRSRLVVTGRDFWYTEKSNPSATQCKNSTTTGWDKAYDFIRTTEAISMYAPGALSGNVLLLLDKPK